MARDYAAQAPNAVRRTDRAIDDDAWMRHFMETAAYGALATVHDGQPFINTNLFVYEADAHVIYLHTARVGRTRANVDAAAEGAAACFSVSTIGRMLPADEALEFSVEYAGVTAFGRLTVVVGEEAERGLQLLLDKYAPHLRPGRDYRPIHPDELVRTSVFRLTIDSWSGKRKQAEDEFPGAFIYAPPSE